MKIRTLTLVLFLWIPFYSMAQSNLTQEQRIVRDSDKKTKKKGKKKKQLSMKQKVKIDQKQDRRARKKKKPN
jgi:hypothetical protein